MIESPVTVIAEVTVNSASHRPTLSLEQRGEASTKVPAAITSRPVTTVNCGTVSRSRQWCRPLHQGARGRRVIGRAMKNGSSLLGEGHRGVVEGHSVCRCLG